MSPNQTDHPLIFISAAEQSADEHGAALIRATLKTAPQARFVGIAGPKMVEAGCEPIYDMTQHSAMLLGAVRAIGRGLAMLRTADEHLRRYPFDAAVVIDSPTLHLPLAGRAHALDVPVMYFIAPQLWAWGANRIYKLRHRVDRVAAILPFEEEYFRSRGVNATYVGHPLANKLEAHTIDEAIVAGIRDIGSPVIALLPGSRRHVVSSILPGQLEVAEQISRAFPRAAFGVSVANPQVAPIIASLAGAARLPVSLHPDHHPELIRAADLALVASGTTTLEVAFHQRPMIVMYKASRLFYHLIGRWLLRTPHLSLPNILAGRTIVPEFMPYYTSVEPIAQCAHQLLQSEEARGKMVEELGRITKPLRERDASRNTAHMLLDMIAEHGH